MEISDADSSTDRLAVVRVIPEDSVQVETQISGAPKDVWKLTTFDLSTYAGQVAGLAL